jgi:LPXTG-motif cell wall-anchored protein
MNRVDISRFLLSRVSAAIFICTMVIGVWAQDTSTTTVQHGPSSFDTQVTNAEVLYVEGNTLVLRMDNGKIEHFVVPDTDKFTVNGSEVTVHDLTPGTKLTQTITTTTTPRYVTTIRTIKGRVWHVNPPKSVTLTLPEGGNQRYTVPEHATFTINGQSKTVFDLRKGMDVETTVITDDPQTVIERSKNVVGQLPPPPATPRAVGMLLIVPARPTATMATAEQPPQTLPKTGSSLPLIGMLGAFALAMSLVLRIIRRNLTL